MNTQEQKNAVRPYVMKLKDLGMGIAMDRPLGDRVMIKPVDPFTDVDRLEKIGLLYAPANAKEQNTPPPTVGEILMIGPQVKDVQVGEIVMFSRYAGMGITIDQGEYKLLHESEIACVLKIANSDAVALIEEDRA